ncbi:hypothetical protein [Niabella aurantiaca]|uniref:hypothetical protein n=1 Tax=Niabella aurantiaca TaxID=379900 RepID=UPI00035DC343|nr:hypothetical protein [Niabella aurantiaca]
MGKTFQYYLLLLTTALTVHSTTSLGQNKDLLQLKNKNLQVSWSRGREGYAIQELKVFTGNDWYRFPEPLGRYTLLYSPEKPDTAALRVTDEHGKVISFPEPEYRYLIGKWRESTSAVALNQAGTAYSFYPGTGISRGDALVFKNTNAIAFTESVWQPDAANGNDIVVRFCVKARRNGYFSIATPTLVNGDARRFQWAVIPGILQGSSVNHNFVDAYAYGHGVPDRPVVARERTASALTSLLTNKDGITLAVTAAPGTGRDPWIKDRSTQSDWLLGLSLMNRERALTPTLYHPVLGEKYSYLKAGDSVVFHFRYTIRKADWYTVYQHVVNDVFSFDRFLSLKQTRQSLSDRVLRLLQYVKHDSTSRWRTFEYNGLTIGAQEYLGGVYESRKDAIKNADYGAMWMMADMTGDAVLKDQRLPYALNFKRAQQQLIDPFFRGAAAGQYYLHGSKRFTEEWGPYTEPIATTYYLLIDAGNILLFDPGHPELKKELRLAADWLLGKMHPEGYWEIAYDNATHKPLFRDERDYRPTFYGLLVAYRILKDKKFLTGAIKGADWFVKNAVDKGYFLGVCGDTRFAPDFATGQSAQALLDLFEVTGMQQYKEAALKVARFYTTSVYTHPVPSVKVKKVKGREVKDWEISQAGLSFEHGGIIGSANTHGPILLASHAGMFVRLYRLTKDRLFLNMARAAAWGRDAFIDPQTGVASYYWNGMNNGAGPFPHHAWWQIGWIMDYLISEADIRSNGQITFPAGFIAPKVGPHQAYGFKSGTIFGTPAKLVLKEGSIHMDNPYIETLTAVSDDQRSCFFILQNNNIHEQSVNISIDFSKLFADEAAPVSSIELYNNDGRYTKIKKGGKLKVHIGPCGLKAIKVNTK